MAFSVANALEMDIFSKCRLLTGDAGLENEILWVNILEILDDLRHIEPGEFLITTAHGFNAKSLERQQELIELFASKKLAAVAIQTGHYLKDIPDSFISFAEGHRIPLIEIPPETSFKNITRALMNRLLQDTYAATMNGEKISLENLPDNQIRAMKILWTQLLGTERPRDLHLELNRFRLAAHDPVVALLINLYDQGIDGTSQEESKVASLLTRAEASAVKILKQMRIPFLLGQSDRYLTVLFQPGRTKIELEAFESGAIKQFINQLKLLFPEEQLKAGVSCLHKDINSLKQALDEAEKALIANSLNLVDCNEIISFKDLGLYRLIMDVTNIETLKSLFLETTAPLLDYDRSCEGALMQTLQQYLESCSIKKAAESLFVHRHTMKYRLEQVHKLTGLNPLQAEAALQLNIGLHIYRYLKALEILA
jgi:DNA-binding PucR family transcriptional regulator